MNSRLFRCLLTFLLLCGPFGYICGHADSLSFENDSLEYTAVKGAPVSISIPIYNFSSEIISNISVKTSCGCLKNTYCPREIFPGEKSVLTFTGMTDDAEENQRVYVKNGTNVVSMAIHITVEDPPGFTMERPPYFLWGRKTSYKEIEPHKFTLIFNPGTNTAISASNILINIGYNATLLSCTTEWQDQTNHLLCHIYVRPTIHVKPGKYKLPINIKATAPGFAPTNYILHASGVMVASERYSDLDISENWPEDIRLPVSQEEAISWYISPPLQGYVDLIATQSVVLLSLANYHSLFDDTFLIAFTENDYRYITLKAPLPCISITFDPVAREIHVEGLAKEYGAIVCSRIDKNPVPCQMLGDTLSIDVSANEQNFTQESILQMSIECLAYTVDVDVRISFKSADILDVCIRKNK